MNLDKIFLFKDERNLTEVNDIYIVLRELQDYYIVKKYDTLVNEDKGIKALSKEYVNNFLYTAADFFNGSTYIGEFGYYKDCTLLEKYLGYSVALVYKDEYNDLLYDSFLENFFVSPSIRPLEDFIPCENKSIKVRFRKCLGKNKI